MHGIFFRNHIRFKEMHDQSQRSYLSYCNVNPYGLRTYFLDIQYSNWIKRSATFFYSIIRLDEYDSVISESFSRFSLPLRVYLLFSLWDFC